jgi:MSHA biogenesis protein MshL
MTSSLIKSVMILLGGILLSSCAHQNALLQSPQSNNTSSIDQINNTLDQALVSQEQKAEALDAKHRPPAVVPDNVVNALTPSMMSDRPAKKRKRNKIPRFDIGVNNLPAADFFAGLVEGTKLNIVVHPDVEGDISLQLKNVSVTEVLEITRDIYGYEFERKGRLIKIFPLGLRTEIFEINYLNVKRTGGSETRVSSGQITAGGSGSSSSESDSSSNNDSDSDQSGGGTGTKINTRNENYFWRNLEKTLTLIVGDDAGRTVVVTPSAGVVVVKADAKGLASVKSYLKSAELILQRQVIIEAKILEVTLNDSYQQGIDWNFTDVSGSVGTTGSDNGLNLSQLSRQIVSGAAGGVFSSTVKVGDFTSTISLLGTQGNVQVLSSPRIATVNNQKAVIKVGTDEYFVTDIDFESNNDSNSNSTDIDLTPFFSGIALDVTPQISEEGKIVLHVHPTISTVEDQEKIITISGEDVSLPLAFSRIRESDSVIAAENGQIVVIGGLIQNNIVDNNATVPFLGDIPLIGELFKQKGSLTEKTELVILLKPTITSADVFNDDIRASQKRFSDFRDEMVEPTETSFYDDETSSM